MKLTVAFFYTVLGCCFIYQDSSRHQISLLSFPCRHSQDKSSPSEMYSHRTSRPKSPPLLTGFPLWPLSHSRLASSKLCLTKQPLTWLFNWLVGEFKGNLCTVVTLYITVTRPFPKGDFYIQVWLYLTFAFGWLEKLGTFFDTKLTCKC